VSDGNPGSAMPSRPIPDSLQFLFTKGQPAGAIMPPPAPPEHATREDPARLSVAMVEAAVDKAARVMIRRTVAELPGVLDRLALQRYGLIMAGGMAALLGAGFLLGWLWSASGYACDMVSYPGWKVCSQWIGFGNGMVAKPKG